MSQKSKKKPKKKLPPRRSKRDQQVEEEISKLGTAQGINPSYDKTIDLEYLLRMSKNDNEELQYQIRVLEDRVSALLYGQTLMESQKEEDHRIKFNLRHSRLA